jgi:hypothetical protein
MLKNHYYEKYDQTFTQNDPRIKIFRFNLFLSHRNVYI